MFVDRTFFENIRPQSSGGPEYMTTVKRLRGGGEHRNSQWADPLRRFSVSLPPQDADAMSDVYDFVADTRGAAAAFRLKDWSDYKSCRVNQEPEADDQLIGVGDGSTYYFRLTKAYGTGYSRRILKPRPGTVKFAVDGLDRLGFVDYDNGVVVFKNPPLAGRQITAGFEFDTPVRFSDDTVDVLMLYHRMGSVQDIQMQEVRMRENIDTDAYDATREAL